MQERALPHRSSGGPLSAAVLLAAGLLGACSSGGSSGGDGPRYNVLLVTLDTTRADRLGCYGHEDAKTPHIDSIAAGGAVFERAISTAGITPMSHSSILSGLNNYRHGMRVFHSEEVSHRLKDAVVTLPEVLGDEGWNTAAMVSSYPVSEIYNLDQGFDTFRTGLDLSDMSFEGQQKHDGKWYEGRALSTQRRGDSTVDDALAWLDEHAADQGADPWCMWVHMFDVHDFSIVPPQDWARERWGLEYDKDQPLQSMEWRARMYDPELAFMDDQIGRILAWLDEHGQRDNTILVITADHGQGLIDGFRRHQWQKHRLLYDWCIRVPFVLDVPGRTGGERVRAQVRTIDIVPTLLDALNLEGPEMEGRSVLPLLDGETEPEPRLAYADALNIYDAHSPSARNLPPGQYDNLFCVTDGRFKLIWHEREPQNNQLFDLQQDPGEVQNIFDDHPQVVARLRAFLDEREAMKVEPPEGGEGGADADKLEALGYVDGEEPDDTQSEEDDE